MSKSNIICIACPKGCRMTVESRGDKILDINGYDCSRGEEYAREEFINPTRVIPTTVRVINGELPLVPVKTAAPIAKELIMSVMKETASIKVKAPIKPGDVIIKNLLGTGIDLIATRTIKSREEKENKVSA